MIALRVLTEEGVQKFRDYIQSVKNNPEQICPDLNTEAFSQEFTPKVEIDENISFSTRMDLAKYLVERFENAGIRREDVIGRGKEGLWSWLAYIWFDRITDGKTKIRETARYICSSDYTDYYRHYVAASYYISSLLGESNSRLFLHSPSHEHNDFIEQFASRQYIISYPDLVETAHTLYWDISRNSPKRGAQSREKTGNHRRFVKMIGQLELTYDIYSMRPDEILRLLPAEFDEWKNPGRTP